MALLRARESRYENGEKEDELENSKERAENDMRYMVEGAPSPIIPSPGQPKRWPERPLGVDISIATLIFILLPDKIKKSSNNCVFHFLLIIGK
jgi:hypothetical protein